jgi:TPR repeat protein
MSLRFQKDPVEAFTYAEKGCNGGHMLSCVNVAIMYSKGEGCEKDEEKSKL